MGPERAYDLVNKQVNKHEKQVQRKLVVRANKEMNRVHLSRSLKNEKKPAVWIVRKKEQ